MPNPPVDVAPADAPHPAWHAHGGSVIVRGGPQDSAGSRPSPRPRPRVDRQVAR